MKKGTILLLAVSLFVASCTSSQPSNQTTDSTTVDSTVVDSTVVDSLSKSTDSLHSESGNIAPTVKPVYVN